MTKKRMWRKVQCSRGKQWDARASKRIGGRIRRMRKPMGKVQAKEDMIEGD